jgi:hypothetical protein
MLYWSSGAAFLLVGAVALARPQLILDIRAHFRRLQDGDPLKGGRRSGFGPREVRVCGLALLIIGAALIRSLVT